MELYNYFRSSASYRVRIALALKGLEYDYKPVHLTKNEHLHESYAAVSASRLVPLLRDGDHMLTQSLAIMEYLDETHPEPPLLPKAPAERARVRALALDVACEIHPLNNLRVLNYLRDQLRQDDAGIGTWYRHWVTEGFRGLEVQAREFSANGRYCFGEAVSLADVLLVPQMFNARRFKTDLTPFPTLVGISTHLEALPAFAAARPEVQPDAQ
jgi:maleylacetoacetate isomerase